MILWLHKLHGRGNQILAFLCKYSATSHPDLFSWNYTKTLKLFALDVYWLIVDEANILIFIQ